MSIDICPKCNISISDTDGSCGCEVIETANRLSALIEKRTMFTDEETLPWVKNKIAVTTTLKAETNSELYGAMHILCSEWQGMERYTKAYKCDQKQGLIANLAGDLQRAIDRLEDLGQDCSEMRATLTKTDEILGMEKPSP